MNRTYLTSPDSGHYLMREDDNKEIYSHTVGSEEAGYIHSSYLVEHYHEYKDYIKMTEEQFKEWETKALMMRELTEIIDDEIKVNIT